MHDIPDLVAHFLTKKATDMKLREVPEIDPETMQSLLNYDWPGNVRELENLVERALILRPKGPVSFDSLMWSVPPASGYPSDKEIEPVLSLDELNRRHIKRTLTLSRGKINGPGGAAELLKTHPNTLRRRMDKLGIKYGKKRLGDDAL